MKITLIIISLLFSLNMLSQDSELRQRKNDSNKVSVFNTETPNHDFDIILHSIGDSKASLSVLFTNDAKFYVEYNDNKSDIISTKAKKPQDVILKNLTAKNRYRIHYSIGNEENYKASEWISFNLKSDSDKPYSFTITADSHLDENCDSEIYINTLKCIEYNKPVFHIDLGDTFMVDKYRDDYTDSYNQYIAQRYYLGLIGDKMPVYLVPGNHDGENLESKRGMTEWAKKQRNMFFPSEFSENYYSFEYNNTLIIVLDPYIFTPKSGMQNQWDRTLGAEQYEWLKKILEQNKSDHKFVFIHNLVGGVDIKGKARGGAEAARFYEWGGYSETGDFDFKKERSGWEQPIHNLLKQHGVYAVFHGHDHVYANQYYDGIKYICVPQPGFRNRPGRLEYAKEYGYQSGVLNNVPGFVKVTINNSMINIEYIDGDNKIIDSFGNK